MHARTHARTGGRTHLQVAVSIIGHTGGVPKEVEAVLHLGVDIVVVVVVGVVVFCLIRADRSVGRPANWLVEFEHAC
jgi:hypothetical protein